MFATAWLQLQNVVWPLFVVVHRIVGSILYFCNLYTATEFHLASNFNIFIGYSMDSLLDQVESFTA